MTLNIRPRKGQRKRTYKANFRPRPYMSKALEAASPKLAEFWKDAIEKA